MCGIIGIVTRREDVGPISFESMFDNWLVGNCLSLGAFPTANGDEIEFGMRCDPFHPVACLCQAHGEKGGGS